MQTSVALPRNQRVRLAELQDIPACAEIFGEWLASAAWMAVGQDLDLSVDHAENLKSRLDNQDEAMFVAEDEDGIHGFVIVRAGTTPRTDIIHKLGSFARKILGRPHRPRGNAQTATLEEIVVKPGRRNSYMSLALFNAATAWCKDRQFTAIEGAVWAANERIIRVSERIGFKPVRVLLRKELD